MVKNYPGSRKGRTLGSGGSSSVGAISYDVEAIKNAFLQRTSGRKLDRKYRDGDGGYFTGGRCGWGVGHIFEEDVQKLMGTFNKVSEMSGAIQALRNCNSSSEFLAHKNALMAKANQAIAEMDLSKIENEVGYSSGLCIIWTDHIADFLGERIIAFKDDLMAQVQEIDRLGYEELVELEKLQIEESKIKKEIEDTFRQAEEAKRRGDNAKAEELYQAVRNLKKKHDGIINQIMTNPWNKASQYDYSRGINNIISALEGKSNPKSSPPPNNRFPNSSGQGQTNGKGRSGENTNLPPNLPNNPWNPNQPNSEQMDQQTLMIIIGAVLLVVFLLMNQKDSSSHRRDYEDYY